PFPITFSQLLNVVFQQYLGIMPYFVTLIFAVTTCAASLPV
ncbi:MAG: hypothetical protein RLZZ574_3511, partial [Cyanobacteriota bacterium]